MSKKEKNTDNKGINSMEKIISLSKRRGFIFQGSEIYGGLAGTWDYGPYGAALSHNIKELSFDIGYEECNYNQQFDFLPINLEKLTLPRDYKGNLNNLPLLMSFRLARNLSFFAFVNQI